MNPIFCPTTVGGVERRQLRPEAVPLQRQRDVPRQQRSDRRGRRREERQLPGLVQKEEEKGERRHAFQPQLAVMMI